MQSYITPDNLTAAILTILVLAWITGQLLGARRQLRELRREKQQPLDEVRGRLTHLEGHLDSDRRRIEALEKRTGKQDEELRLLLRAQMAMMSHVLNGNSVERIAQCRDDINEYLTRLT